MDWKKRMLKEHREWKARKGRGTSRSSELRPSVGSAQCMCKHKPRAHMGDRCAGQVKGRPCPCAYRHGTPLATTRSARRDRARQNATLIRRQTSAPEYECPKCGGPLVVRTSVYGQFFGCSTYPACDGKAKLVRASDGTIHARVPGHVRRVAPPPLSPARSTPAEQAERDASARAHSDWVRVQASDLAARVEGALQANEGAFDALLGALDGWRATETYPAAPPPARIESELGVAYVGLWEVRLVRGRKGGLALVRDRFDEVYATYFERAG